jgi:hypothetical protein
VAEPVIEDGVWFADMDREVSSLTINVDGAEKTQPLTRLFAEWGPALLCE